MSSAPRSRRWPSGRWRSLPPLGSCSTASRRPASTRSGGAVRRAGGDGSAASLVDLVGAVVLGLDLAADLAAWEIGGVDVHVGVAAQEDANGAGEVTCSDVLAWDT